MSANGLQWITTLCFCLLLRLKHISDIVAIGIYRLFYFYLHKYENQLYHRECNFNSRITVEVAHIAGNLENVHGNTEESK